MKLSRLLEHQKKPILKINELNIFLKKKKFEKRPTLTGMFKKEKF